MTNRRHTMGQLPTTHITDAGIIASKAVWHFFIGGDKEFESLYEDRLVDTHKQQDEIYVLCSKYLLDNEMYVANLLDEDASNELLNMVIRPLASHIENILKEDEHA